MYILSLWLPMGVFGVPVASFGPTFGFFGSSGLTLGSLWVPFGIPLAPIGLPRARPWPGRDSSAFGEGKVSFRVHETIVWYTEADLPDLPDLADLAEVVSASAPRTLPSTRAGG